MNITPWPALSKNQQRLTHRGTSLFANEIELGATWPKNTSFEQFDQFMSNQNAYVLSLDNGMECGGFGWRPDFDNNKHAWFYYYVFTNHQGKGLAKDMLMTIIQYLRQNGYQLTFARVHNGNTPSIKALKAVGFSECMTHHEHLNHNIYNIRLNQTHAKSEPFSL